MFKTTYFIKTWWSRHESPSSGTFCYKVTMFRTFLQIVFLHCTSCHKGFWWWGYDTQCFSTLNGIQLWFTSTIILCCRYKPLYICCPLHSCVSRVNYHRTIVVKGIRTRDNQNGTYCSLTWQRFSFSDFIGWVWGSPVEPVFFGSHAARLHLS